MLSGKPHSKLALDVDTLEPGDLLQRTFITRNHHQRSWAQASVGDLVLYLGIKKGTKKDVGDTHMYWEFADQEVRRVGSYLLSRNYRLVARIKDAEG